jgi:hypothetical protein
MGEGRRSALSLRAAISKGITRLQFRWIGRPRQILFFGCGIGDDLLCTAVAREFARRGRGQTVMFSRYPALFEQNPDVAAVYNYGYPTVGRLRRWGYSCTVPQYSDDDFAHDRDIFQNEPVIVTMCRSASVTGVVDLRPYLNLLPSEKAAGHLMKNQVVIQSSGLAVGPGVMKNKDWYPERFQAVADAIQGSVNLIQLGQKTAAIMASSVLFIGQVGFMMHLARAVDCRGVIVYGGRETPGISGYIANENVVGLTFCSPCWQRNKCDFGRECMRMIQPAEVTAAVRRQLARVGTPLELEQVDIDASPAPHAFPPAPQV